MSDGRGRSFTLEVSTPESAPRRLEAGSVVFPASDGMVGVLAGRAPLVAVLAAGTVSVSLADGGSESYFVSGGFARVHEGGMAILADQFVPAGSLDPDLARQELAQARAMPARTDPQHSARAKAVQAAGRKLALAQDSQNRPGQSK